MNRGVRDENDLDALAPLGRGLFSVDGMWCPSCAAAAERVLARSPGVIRARVSFPTASALVEWDPDRVDLRAALDGVVRLGYGVGPPEATAQTVARIDYALRDLSIRLAVTAFFGMWVMVLTLLRYLQPGQFSDTAAGHVLALATLGLALPVIVFAAAPFWAAGWRTLRAGVPGMDALVSIGIAGAVVLSALELRAGGADVYADTAVMLTALLSIGRLIEMRTSRRAAQAISALESELPERAWPAARGPARPADSFAAGDLIRVPAGARVPLDGTITEAATRLDMAVLTGESLPVPHGPGDGVMAGAVNLDTPVIVRVTGPVGARRVDRIMGRMIEMQGDKSRLARLADRVARVLVPTALVLATLVLVVGWVAGLGAQAAALRALSVVVIACPCALSIAVPIVFLGFAERGVRAGVLFRAPAALEHLGLVRVLALDKTGTLTEGRLSVTNVETAPGVTTGVLRDLAATAESGIDHPVARALSDAGTATEAKRTRHPRGVSAVLPDGAEIRVGSADFLREAGIDVPAAEATGGAVEVAQGGAWIGRLHLADTVRADARAALAGIAASGVRLTMLTGDAQGPALAVAQAVGLASGQVHARLSPEDKARHVRELQAEGPVALVGDGVNDSLALATAEVGIAIDGASHAATAGADAVVTRDGLNAVATGLALARLARRRMLQNLGFALVYNTAALPLAAVGAIPPVAAAGAMLLSSLSVLANATRPVRI